MSAGGRVPAGMPVPSRICGDCGEFLPHWCAAEVTFTRQRWTGRRLLKITDRQHRDEAAA